jgi:Regulator of chromosome condensation (RCC1) repeat
MKDSSVRLAYEAQPRPRPIVAFSEKKVVKVACGTNHTGSFIFCFIFYITIKIFI